MKFFTVILYLFLIGPAQAQTPLFYAAAESGLSMRDFPDKNAKAIEKIGYGEKVIPDYSINPIDSAGLLSISAEGYEGYWQRVKYKGKTGYVVNSYLWEIPPPRKGTKTLEDYIKQLSTPAGPPVIVTTNYNDYTETSKKQLYKNGAQINKWELYEADNNTYIIPRLTIEKGFMLIKLLKLFPEMLEDGAFFPQADKKYKKADIEVDVKVMKECTGSGTEKYCTLYKVLFSYQQGAYYHLTITELNGELVISYGGGV